MFSSVIVRGFLISLLAVCLHACSSESLSSDETFFSTPDTNPIPNPVPEKNPGIVNTRISSSSDDAEELLDGSMYLNSSDLELINDPNETSGNADQVVGMRFMLNVPKGATITNAYLQFTTDEASTNSTNLQIRVEASDNAAEFTNSTGNISSRPTGSNVINWSPDAWNIIGESTTKQRSPDIKALIEEITSRANWSINNYIAIIISGDGHRTAESFDGNSDQAPILTVEYTTPDLPPSSNTGVATLNWTPPTKNTDDSLLENLKGYKIYYGLSPEALSETVTINNAGVTEHVIENLSTNMEYFFTITSLNSSDIESPYSEIVSKYIQ